jgi:hypothetical protein
MLALKAGYESKTQPLNISFDDERTKKEETV